MTGLVWKLPLLRRLSPMGRGFLAAVSGTLAPSAGLFVFLVSYVEPEIEPSIFGDLAQVGATLLVSYAIEISWLLKESGARSARRENWVGFVAGVGCSGLAGIASALVLAGHHGRLTWIEEMAVAWSFLSLLMLGFLVASLPLLIYEWAHDLRTEYSDE
jgi:hypothetical protein